MGEKNAAIKINCIMGEKWEYNYILFLIYRVKVILILFLKDKMMEYANGIFRSNVTLKSVAFRKSLLSNEEL